MPRTICVMGIGNVLMGDDALGPFVLKSLEAAWIFPAGVHLIDAGTPGLDLTFLLDGVEALIAIDALSRAGPAGEVRCYQRDQLLAGKVPLVISPHEPSLIEALLRLDFLGRCPAEALLIGAIPERVATFAGLSDCLRRAVPLIEAHVLRELSRLGAAPARRPSPLRPDLWWERAPAKGASDVPGLRLR